MKETIRRWVRDFLGLREFDGVNLDSPEAIDACRTVLAKKRFLHRLYFDYYQIFLRHAELLRNRPGVLLELGSGGGFLKDVLPGVVTSEVCASLHVDRLASAENLSFDKDQLKAIFMLNVLHHVSDPEAFFREASRCLAPGGRVVMIEPYNSRCGRFIYQRLHHEPFDASASRWTIALPGGRLHTANIALPWIIFWRDRSLFEKRFPELKILSIERHTVLRYLVSGGLSWKALVPAWTYSVFRLVDEVLARFPSVFPIFQTIVLEKQ